MRVADFLTLNLRDAEQRLGRLTAPCVDAQADLWRALDASLPGRGVAAIGRLIDRARPSSRAFAAREELKRVGATLDPLLRMRALGSVVAIAAGVHVALASTTAPAGKWWLIVPGMAATFGAAAFALSWRGPKPTGRRW